MSATSLLDRTGGSSATGRRAAPTQDAPTGRRRHRPTVSVVIISRDEPALADTIEALARQTPRPPDEVVVVDASAGRLDWIRARHPRLRWVPFAPPSGAAVTIAHQRNAGLEAATGDIVVFTDCGCLPGPGWMAALVRPIVEEGEEATCGPARSSRPSVYDTGGPPTASAAEPGYVDGCATINLAFRRAVLERVGPFDESFDYGSDLDFTWRMGAAGIRIRTVPEAWVSHDWGDLRRQLRRAYVYGVARVRLYRKHRNRIASIPRTEPMTVAYPLFLLGLPLALRYRAYLLLLVVPLWRNRHHRPWAVLADHLSYGAGVLAELAGVEARRRRWKS